MRETPAVAEDVEGEAVGDQELHSQGSNTMQHNADLAAVVSTGGASGAAPNIDNEVVQEMDEEDMASDVNSS